MADTDISSELTPAPTPVESAREASLTLLEQRLPHEQAKVLKAERRAKASAKLPSLPQRLDQKRPLPMATR